MRMLDFAESYADRHDVSEGYRNQLLWCVKALDRYHRSPVILEEITSDLINQWLKAMKTEGLSAQTRSNRRRMIMTLVTEAARLRKLEPLAPELVCRVKLQRRSPEGLSREQARKVIDRIRHPVAAHREWLWFRYRKLGICRGDWWLAYLLATWDSGAPADVRLLRFEDINPDGSVHLWRHKTGKRLDWQLSRGTLEAIEAIRQPERELVFPLPGNMSLFRREARYVIEAIGGFRRSLGGFRSGAGTDAEILHGSGAGCKLLGNSPAVFEKHYAIRQLIPGQAIAPRPLVG